MLTKRIIPCLDVDRGRVVKGVKFFDHVDAGDPVEQAEFYDREKADELVFYDITASHEGRAIMVDLPARTGRARVAAGGQGAAALAMIVDEVSIREAGRRWRMSERRARKLLLDALALWPDYLAEARDGIDERDLARVCARLG